MKERPVNFKEEEVRAILGGRKTQFRRILRTQPEAGSPCPYHIGVGRDRKARVCPFGAPGDRLWVRETWADVRGMGFERHLFPLGAAYKADCTSEGSLRIAKEYGAVWYSPIYMPREMSRVTLEVVSAKVERLQDISDYAAMNEGVKRDGCKTYRDAFWHTWQSIHGSDSWDANPWVWVVEFKVVKGGAQ